VGYTIQEEPKAGSGALRFGFLLDRSQELAAGIEESGAFDELVAFERFLGTA
jgi:hypothetical protein